MDSLITKEEILSHENKLPEIDSIIFDRVSDYLFKEGVEKSTEKYKSLPMSYKVVYSTICIEGEIFNGGFSQYFSNSTAEEFHFDGIMAFKELGANKIASVIENAFENVLKQSSYFRSSYQIEGIQEAFNNINDVEDLDLSEFDDSFYEIMDSEDIGKRRVAFIFKNISQF